MFAKDEAIDVREGFIVYLLVYTLFRNSIFAASVGVLVAFILAYYRSRITQFDSQRAHRGLKFSIFESKLLPNTVMIDIGQHLYAYTGFLFLSTIEDDISVATLRLQSQFGTSHTYSQLGSLYLLNYKYEITSSWENVPEAKKLYVLQQCNQHITNFQRVLQEMLPGVKFRVLSIDEVMDELVVCINPPNPIDLLPSNDSKITFNSSSMEITLPPSENDQDLPESPIATPPILPKIP